MTGSREGIQEGALLVGDGRRSVKRRGDWCEVGIPRILDAEVVVFPT